MKKIIVSVSGGKDSTATFLLALDRKGQSKVIPIFADTGNEHQITYDYLDYLEQKLNIKITRLKANFDEKIKKKREYVKKNWPSKLAEKALPYLKPTGNLFLDLAIWKGRFPSRMAQFCTTELKANPLDNFTMRRVTQGHIVESWQGTRRDESVKRRSLSEYEQKDGYTIVRPIVAWDAQRVVSFIKSKGLKLNPLYSLGFRRVGCMPCINSNKGDIFNTHKRFPDVIERLRNWESIASKTAKREIATFFPPIKAGIPNPINEVIKWSKTKHGGKEAREGVDEMPPVCSSYYGLCE